MPRLSGLYEQHPEIDLQIAIFRRPNDIRLEGADCAVWHGVRGWTDIEFVYLFDDELVPVCSPALAVRLTIYTELIADHNQLFFSNQLGAARRFGVTDQTVQNEPLAGSIARDHKNRGNSSAQPGRIA